MDTTNFDIVMPPEALRPFVRRYIYANEELPEPLTILPKPTGYTYFVNCFGDSRGDFISVNSLRSPRRSQWYFLGQIIGQDIRIEYAARVAWIACELAPTAFHRLSGLPASRITGVVTPLEAVRPDLGEVAAEIFLKRLGACREDYVSEMNRFVVRLAEGSRAPDPILEHAVAIFEAANGAIHVNEICKATGVGERHLRRRFAEIVGVSPKYFGQILQINWVVGLLYSNDQTTLAGIAQEAGFYDQAHFNRAMRRFFREGPSEFLKSDHVAFKTFIGTSRRYGPASVADQT